MSATPNRRISSGKAVARKRTTVDIDSLPHQRVGDHATLFLCADSLIQWKQESPRDAHDVAAADQKRSARRAAARRNGDGIEKDEDEEDDLHHDDQLQQQQQQPSNAATTTSSPLPPPVAPSDLHAGFTYSGQGSIVDSSTTDRVLVINLGGTLGMAPSEDGRLRPRPRYLLEQMLNLHELRYPEVPAFDFVEYRHLVDSSDLGGPHWERIARDIDHFYDDYVGFLIAHGTDTLHYTAAALAFALDQLAKPVVVMGSMIPLCELYTDTRRNVTAALRFAGSGSFLQPGVYVFFHEQLFSATRCVKINDSLRAFDSPNAPAAGDLNTLRFVRSPTDLDDTSGGVPSLSTATLVASNTSKAAAAAGGSGPAPLSTATMSQKDVQSAVYRVLSATTNVTAPLRLRAQYSDRVLCVAITPDTMITRQLSRLFDAGAASGGGRSRSTSVSKTGSGGAGGTKHRRRNNVTPRAIIVRVPEMNFLGSMRLAQSLQNFGAAAARRADCGVFAVSSAPYNGLSPSTVAALLTHVPDVVPLNDMLAETAVVKAKWLLGQNPKMPLDKLRRLMFVNLRGEVSETTKSLVRPPVGVSSKL